MRIIDLSKVEIEENLKNGKITVCVVGMGRIGLPTAALFANAGANVVGVDISKRVVQDLASGECSFHDEAGLNELLKKVVNEGRLKTISDVTSGVAKSDVVIVCVPTPVTVNKIPHIKAIRKACVEIGKSLRRGSLVVVESTVSPGSIENTVIPLIEKYSGMKAPKDFGVASCPERASPGDSLNNMKSVPRVVGGVDQKSTDAAVALYQCALGAKTIVVSNPKTANAVKLTENIFRDVNIALMNEFALLYEKIGIDTIEVVNACASKWNFVAHYPGAGVGGPCLPANAYYIIDEGLKVGYIPSLIRTAREVNDRMPDHVVTLVTEALNNIGKVVSKSKIALLGVSYKPDLHDLQMTPFKRIYETLKEMGASIAIYDPIFKGEEVFGSKVLDTLKEAVENADCIIIGTAHKEIKNLDFAEIIKLCNNPAALVDAQHIIEPAKAKEIGFSYIGIGRRL
jgi:nucleotide sugar dehydrogenase